MGAHQPGSEPIDIPETIPNPVVVPKPTPTPTEPAPKRPVGSRRRFPRGGVSRADNWTSGMGKSRCAATHAPGPAYENLQVRLHRQRPRRRRAGGVEEVSETTNGLHKAGGVRAS